MNPLVLLVSAGAAVALTVLAWRVLGQPLLVVWVLVAALPVGIVHLAGGVPVVQVLSAAAAGAAALAASTGAGPPLRRPGPLLWATALVGTAFVSVVTATEPLLSLRAAVASALGLGLAWAVAWGCRDWATLQRLVTLLSMVGAAMCLTALSSVTQLRAAHSGNVVTGRATGLFGQPNELGSFAAMVLLLALAAAVSWRRPAARVACCAAAGTGGVALLLSLSRGAWIGVSLGLLLLLVLLPPLRRALALGGAAVVGSLALSATTSAGPALAVVLERLRSISHPANPYDDRPAIWAEAVRQALTHPLLGVGPAGFPSTSVSDGSVLQASPADHAHNIVLVLVSEHGFLGLCLFAGLVLAAARSGMRAYGRLRSAGSVTTRRAALLAGFLAAFTSVLGQGAIDFPLRHPVLATTVWLLLGLLVAASNIPVPEAATAPGSGADQPPDSGASSQPSRVSAGLGLSSRVSSP